MPDLSPQTSPVRSIKSIKSVLRNIDLAHSHVPHTQDAALDPANQHAHHHTMHIEGVNDHDRGVVYADIGIGSRIDPEDMPRAPRSHRPIPGEHPDASELHDEKIAQSSTMSDSMGEAEIEDPAKGPLTANEDSLESSSQLTPYDKFRLLTRRYRWVIVLVFGLFFTSWWMSIIIQKKTRHRWLIPTFLWLLLMIRFITFYVPTRPILTVTGWIYRKTFVKVRDRIPEKWWPFCELFIVLIMFLVPTFATKEYPGSSYSDRAVSFFGYVVFFTGFWVVSKHKSQIKWHTVFVGMFLQYVIALFVLRTKAGYDFFNWISFLARELLGFATNGAEFLTSQQFVESNPWFIFSTLCSILFFIAFIHIWYYFGWLQWVVIKTGYGFFWLFKISGAEAVVAAATPFVGQGDSAILIKPFLPHATEAEIFQILVSGFATISGSVLGAYVNLGLSPQALITSCVMSIPASISAAKLVIPETEQALTADRIVIPEDATEEAHNALHAFSNGAMFGLQVAFAIGANILCIIALVALIDAILGWFGKFWGIPHLTLEQILGYVFYPVAFLLGVPRNGDLYKVGKLLGTKIIQNEFVAYTALVKDPEYAHLSLRSRILVTYALCGFSNLGSVGIQIGVLSKIAPDRKGTVAGMAMLSLFVGCFVTMSSAATAGMVMADMKMYAKALNVKT